MTKPSNVISFPFSPAAGVPVVDYAKADATYANRVIAASQMLYDVVHERDGQLEYLLLSNMLDGILRPAMQSAHAMLLRVKS